MILTLFGMNQFDAAKLKKLRPSFKEDGGSVTAGNASSIRSSFISQLCFFICNSACILCCLLPTATYWLWFTLVDSDGAAALVLVSGEKALELGLRVIAKIRGYADAAQAPELFTTTPALAIPKAIKQAGLDASQVDYYEINEAFSVIAFTELSVFYSCWVCI